MVTAGVYLIARTHPLFEMAPSVQLLVALIGLITLLLSGFTAMTQSDIKRILAYSTVSQIGYSWGLGRSLVCSDLPPDDSCLFQGAVVPCLRYRNPEPAS